MADHLAFLALALGICPPDRAQLHRCRTAHAEFTRSVVAIRTAVKEPECSAVYLQLSC